MSSANYAGPDVAASQRRRFTRRHLLTGLGVAVTLPVLASLRRTSQFATKALPAAAVGTTSTGAPLRAAFIYVPNGTIADSWWPNGEGDNFALSQSLQPLEIVNNRIQVLGGLGHQTADAGPNGIDGAGEHARANGTFLTGVRLKKSATDVQNGVSIDQILAREVGKLTRFPSLELGCDAVRKSSACDSGYACAYQFNLSWSSPTTPMAPESNPRLVFERLFGTRGPRLQPPGEPQASPDKGSDPCSTSSSTMPRRCSDGSTWKTRASSINT